MKRGIGIDILLLFSGMSWGMGYIFSKIALDGGFGAPLMIFLRFAVSATLFIIIIWVKKEKIRKIEMMIGMISGAMLFFGYYLQLFGLRFTTPSANALLSSTSIVILPFVIWVLLKQRPSAKIFAAAFLFVIGVGFLTWRGVSRFTINVGDALSLIGAAFFALNTAYLSVRLYKCDPIRLMCVQMLSAATLAAIATGIFDSASLAEANYGVGLWAILYLALVNTGAVLYIQNYALGRVSPIKVGMYLSTESLFAAVFSVLLGYESPSVSLTIGGILIFSAIMLMEIKMKK